MNSTVKVTLSVGELYADLKACLGIESDKELVDEALTLLEWAAEKTSKGEIVGSHNFEDDSFQPYVTPFFQRIAQERD